MYDSATYTRANVEKTDNSQVCLEARSDYNKPDCAPGRQEITRKGEEPR